MVPSASIKCAALQYVQPGTIVGVGTGSTAAHFIDARGTKAVHYTISRLTAH
ncbi:hypothetical protein ACUOFC_36135, partial [Escherichia sp. TWPC-MK]